MPDLTREEVETIIACAEHNSPALEANEIRRLGALALRQMDEIERLLVEYRKMYDWGEVLDKDRNTLTTDLAAAERARDRAQCRLAEVATVLQGDRGSGAESPDPRWSFALEQARERMADLVAARATIDRVQALANEIEAQAPAYDGKKVYADLRTMAAAIRGAAALRGGGAKDARS